MNFNPVFILSLFDTAILTAKCIYSKEIKILGFDYRKDMPGFYSKYLEAHICPNPNTENEKLVEFLLEKCKNFSLKPVLIAASDEFTHFINMNRAELESSFLFLMPPKEIVDTFLSKIKQLDFVRNYGLDYPKYCVINKENLEDEIKSINCPVIIKPNNFKSMNIFKNKVHIANNCNEIKSIVEKYPGANFLVQEIITGDSKNNYEVNALYLGGDNIYLQVIRKIRQFPDDFGTGCLIETTENDYLLSLTKELIISLKLYGFSNTEFKYSPIDNKYYFIETNLRPWLQIDLTKYDGNFVKLFYDFITKREINYNIVRNFNVYRWVDIINDFTVSIKLLRSKKIKILDFFKSYLKIKSTGILNPADFKLFFHELNLIKRIVKKLRGL